MFAVDEMKTRGQSEQLGEGGRCLLIEGVEDRMGEGYSFILV